MVVLVKELESSKASSTLSKYASRWKTWCAWSSSTLHIPAILAKPLHVALFLTEMFLSRVERGAGSSALESASQLCVLLDGGITQPVLIHQRTTHSCIFLLFGSINSILGDFFVCSCQVATHTRSFLKPLSFWFKLETFCLFFQ